MSAAEPEAILVLPHVRVQNANAIASPLTHGFPSITAFTGLMWALQRKLNAAGVPLQLHGVGVICHHHQEQVTQGFAQSFRLRKPAVATAVQARKLEEGTPPAIVEEGRMHLRITLVFSVSEQRAPGALARLVDGDEALGAWAAQAGTLLAQMRVAGGSVLPSVPAPGQRVRPWMAVLPEDPEEAARAFRRWRRQWLPGFALVGRDALLAERLALLQQTQPQATLLDAWLHASRFNHVPLPACEGEPAARDGRDQREGRVRWGDPLRGAGSGWVVPLAVGYGALSPRHAPGTVRNARDPATALRFVESVYSLGEWVSPHRLRQLSELLWQPECDDALGLYRCRNRYQPPAADDDAAEAGKAGQGEEHDKAPLLADDDAWGADDGYVFDA